MYVGKHFLNQPNKSKRTTPSKQTKKAHTPKKKPTKKENLDKKTQLNLHQNSFFLSYLERGGGHKLSISILTRNFKARANLYFFFHFFLSYFFFVY